MSEKKPAFRDTDLIGLGQGSKTNAPAKWVQPKTSQGLAKPPSPNANELGNHRHMEVENGKLPLARGQLLILPSIPCAWCYLITFLA